MTYIAGVDIGNSTTEVCIGEVGGAQVHFLSSASCKTTGRKRQEDDIEGKQEKERNVKRILGIYHKGTLQKEIIKGDGLIGMVNWA